jgi:cell fate (sporulation/competence/biofilm development) regulator YlbF (YheA/YmcA/DUF963 family)
MNVYDYAHALAKAIRSSSEYRAFKKALESLEKDSAAKEMLSDFRKSQWELQQQKLAGLEISPEQEQRLSRVWEIVRLNMVVKDYLEAEYKFSVMLSDIQKIIGEPLEDVIAQEIEELRSEQNKGQQKE